MTQTGFAIPVRHAIEGVNRRDRQVYPDERLAIDANTASLSPNTKRSTTPKADGALSAIGEVESVDLQWTTTTNRT